MVSFDNMLAARAAHVVILKRQPYEREQRTESLSTGTTRREHHDRIENHGRVASVESHSQTPAVVVGVARDRSCLYVTLPEPDIPAGRSHHSPLWDCNWKNSLNQMTAMCIEQETNLRNAIAGRSPSLASAWK